MAVFLVEQEVQAMEEHTEARKQEPKPETQEMDQ
jgi:hypothetical protein